MRRHSLRNSKRPEFYAILPKRNYVEQPLKKKRKKKEPLIYTEEAVLRAAEACFGGMSRNYAARLYRVPSYQIYKIIDHFKSVFTYGQEKELATKILKMISRGFVFSETDIRTLAYDFAEKKKLQHNFCSIKKMAGIDWILYFKKSNPDIPMVKESSNDRSRPENSNSKEILNNYCNIFSDIMNQSNLINTPQLIYNVDKAVFVTKSSIKNSVTRVTVKDAVTMLICANAAGDPIPPMAFCYEKNQQLTEKHLPKDTLVTTSDYDEPGENIFVHWLDHFQKHRHRGSCLLLLDGNPWHKTFQAIDFCEKNKIQMLCVPTQNLHPLSGIVAELESDYNSNYLSVDEIASLKRVDHSFDRFFPVALAKAATPAAIQDSFSRVGVYPLNIKAILENAFLISSCITNSPLTVDSSDELATAETDKEQLPLNMNLEKPRVREETGHAIFPLSFNSMVCIKQEIFSEMSLDVTHEICRPIPEYTIPIFEDKTAVNKQRSLTTASHTQSQSNNKQKLCSIHSDSLAFSAPVDELKVHLAETCLFCYVKFSDPVSVQLGGIIQCQGEGGELFHQRCVGAKGNEEFICGRCVISRLRASDTH